MAKKNCWEVKRCNRGPGSSAPCPAATEQRLTGVNQGQAGGRTCWAINGTGCDGKTQGSFSMKLPECLRCAFYTQVRSEEGPGLAVVRDVLARLK